MSECEDHFNLESGWPPWNDEPNEAARTSISGVADAAMVLFGVLMVSFGAPVIVVPFMILDGLGPRRKTGGVFTATFGIDLILGLLSMRVGSLLIWWRRWVVPAVGMRFPAIGTEVIRTAVSSLPEVSCRPR